MEFTLPYDIHEMIIAKHIKSYADFMRYMIFVNNGENARMLYAKFASLFMNNINDVRLFAFCADHKILTDCPIKLVIIRDDIVIPFCANVVSLVIHTRTFNPDIFVNYAHLTDIVFIKWDFTMDCKVLAKTFPKLQRISCWNIDFIARFVDYLPNLFSVYSLSHTFNKMDFIKKHRQIDFLFLANDSMPYTRDEPNVKYKACIEISEIDTIAHLAYKIVDLTIALNYEYGEIYIPEIFREVTYLSVINNRYNDIIISGFQNLDTLSITSHPRNMGFLTLMDLPYLNKVITNIE
jgi:hypothetical protein